MLSEISQAWKTNPTRSHLCLESKTWNSKKQKADGGEQKSELEHDDQGLQPLLHLSLETYCAAHQV